MRKLEWWGYILSRFNSDPRSSQYDRQTVRMAVARYCTCMQR